MMSANRNAGTSSARRRSAYLDTVKSTVHTVPLRLFHLFHNTTSYCEAALIQLGKRYSSLFSDDFLSFSRKVTLAQVCS